MERLKKCPICERKKFSSYAVVKGTLTKKQFNVVQCKFCDFIFVNPRLDPNENSKLYTDDYFNGVGFDKSVDYVSAIKDANVVADEGAGIIARIELFNENFSKKGKQNRKLNKKTLQILDVGCGTGVQLKALQNDGYSSLMGIELSKFASGIAKKHTKANIVNADFLDYNFKNKQFDVIIATEVIEHVREPLDFLKKIRSLLKKDGLFIYSTGNTKSLSARIMRSYWHYISPEGHISYFSPKTMSIALQRAKLTAIEYNEFSKQSKRLLLKADDRAIVCALKNSRKNHNQLFVRIVCTILIILPSFIAARLITLIIAKYKLPLATRKY